MGEFCRQVGVSLGLWRREVNSPPNKRVPAVFGPSILAAHRVGCQGNKMYECYGRKPTHSVTKLRLVIALIATFPQPHFGGSFSSLLDFCRFPKND